MLILNHINKIRNQKQAKFICVILEKTGLVSTGASGQINGKNYTFNNL